jgi:hypothetical protein
VIVRASILALSVILAGAALPPARAESAVGRWSFETARIGACRLAGDMTIVPAAGKEGAKGALTCSFTAVQTCPGPPDIEIRVQQACRGRQVNAFVTLDSAIEKILSVKPDSLAKGMEQRYAPDNFRVSLSADGQEMTGTFVSLGSAFVRFVRLPDLSS